MNPSNLAFGASICFAVLTLVLVAMAEYLGAQTSEATVASALFVIWFLVLGHIVK